MVIITGDVGAIPQTPHHLQLRWVRPCANSDGPAIHNPGLGPEAIMTTKRNIANSPLFFQRSGARPSTTCRIGPAVNNLSRDKQIEIIAALTEGMSIRAVERLTGIHRDTIMRLGARVGRGCAELHDRMMVGLRVGRLELDELWAFVGKKQKRVKRHETRKGDQYTFVALASSAKAIVSYRTGKRDSENTDDFVRDLRERVLGSPEISTDGWHPYKNAIRDAFGNRVAHGVIIKTYSVTDLTQGRRAPLQPGRRSSRKPRGSSGVPAAISTSYVERQNLSIRMACRRFRRPDQRLQQEAGEPRGGRVACTSRTTISAACMRP